MRDIVIGSIATGCVAGFGFLIWKFILNPLLDYQKIKQEIVKKLSLYSNLFCNCIEYLNDDFWINNSDKEDFEKNKLKYELAQIDLKKLASDLKAFPAGVSNYKLLSEINVFPKITILNDAYGKIIGISNRMLIHGKVLSKDLNLNVINSNESDEIKNILNLDNNKNMNKKYKMVIGLIPVIIILVVFIVWITKDVKKNNCYDLDVRENNFNEQIDRCYLSGVINQERKDYLIKKYDDYTLSNKKVVVANDKIIDFTTVTMSPQDVQHNLYFASDYCNSNNSFCNGCKINFFNLGDSVNSDIIFSQDSKNSGMNFIDNKKIALLNEDFCFNLDCGDYESSNVCFAKSTINKK